MTKSTPFTSGAGDTYARRFLFLATTMLVGMALLAGCNADREEPKQDTEKHPEIAYLDQGWSSDLRTRYYFDPQGSRLIPYDWFVALEQPDSDRPFIDPAHVEALGYLAAAPGPMNPDGLPIGFVKDPADNPETGHWMGFTCAACHTNDMVLAGRRVRVDGGPPLADFETFMTRLNDAVVATLGNDAKFERFADRVAPKDGAKALRGRLLDYQSSLTALVERNRTPPLWRRPPRRLRPYPQRRLRTRARRAAQYPAPRRPGELSIPVADAETGVGAMERLRRQPHGPQRGRGPGHLRHPRTGHHTGQDVHVQRHRGRSRGDGSLAPPIEAAGVAEDHPGPAGPREGRGRTRPV